MTTPIISIIMPVYNSEKFLAQTIQSVRNQTFRDFELICVDDGSTDASVEHLREFMQEDDRITLLQQANAGAGAARNRGFAHSRGEYVIFLDSDDLFSNRLLEKLYQAISVNRCDVAACNFSRFDPQGNEKQFDGVYTKWIPKGLKVFSYRDLPDHIMRVINPVPWNKMYRSAFIREKGLKFDEISSTNDISFASVSVASAERVTYVTDSLIRYRIGHSGTITSGKSTKLENVKTAVLSALRQAEALPHADLIRRDIACFAVGNFLYALSNYVPDFSQKQAKEFYTLVHDTFNQTLFDGVKPELLHHDKLYQDFRTVRKHDYETMKRLISKRLIVSFTTYPARVHLVPQVLESIEKQTRKADEVVLWLAREQFPGKEGDLPESVRKLLEEKRLTLRWCDDLKPHKKYFYALQEYTDDLVVTIDDDLLYSPHMLSSLYASYLLYPDAVSTVRAHLILVDEQQRILPYGCWIQETDACMHEPSMQLLATGGAGVLHPPGLYRKEMFDAAAIRENCLWADDLWLKAMQLVSDVPVVLARQFELLRYLPDSQENALQIRNVQQRQNDVQLERTIKWLDQTFEPGIFIRKLTADCGGERILGMEAVSDHLNRERKLNRRMYLQTNTKLKNAEYRLKNTENQLKNADNKRLQAELELKKTLDEMQRLQRTVGKLEESQNRLRQELDGCQAKRRESEDKLRRTQQELRNVQAAQRDTAGKLRMAQENAPIGRQLKNLGAQLRRRREAGENPVSAAFKFGVYLLAWIPEKMLSGMMYYLHNGAKQTIKKILRK